MRDVPSLREERVAGTARRCATDVEPRNIGVPEKYGGRERGKRCCAVRVVEDRAAIPDKVFKDCQNCPRLYRCDEVAMARGQVPKVSILGPRIEAEQLVRISG